MALYPKYFETYVNQVEVGEAAGKTGDVLNRISDQIKNANKIMGKLKSALAYPVMVLVFTFGASAYLFTSVIPDMLDMLTDIGVAELPATTQLVMNVGRLDETERSGFRSSAWRRYWIPGRLFQNRRHDVDVENLDRVAIDWEGHSEQRHGSFFRNWQQMILAGAEMSVALKSAATPSRTYISTVF